jgi:hypothetical protein
MAMTCVCGGVVVVVCVCWAVLSSQGAGPVFFRVAVHNLHVKIYVQ